MEVITAIESTVDEVGTEPLVYDYIYTLCLNDLRKKSTLLTRGEEKRLFEELAICATEEDREKIIYRIWAANVRLAIKVSKRFSWILENHPEVSEMDLINEGALGVREAILKFDVTRGNKFSTYAYFWIYQAMSRAVQNYLIDTIRLPVHIQEKLNKMDEILRKYEGREIEFAKKIRGLEEAFKIRKPLSLNRKLAFSKNSELNEEFGDVIADPNALSPVEEAMDSEMQEKIAAAMEGLNPREREVIILRFGLNGQTPKTLEEIARMFGVCRERIRQIEANALKKLKHPVRVDKLRNLL